MTSENTPEMREIWCKEAEKGVGCLGGCCLMLAWVGLAMPFAYFFFRDFFESIPLLGNHPIIGPIVFVVVFLKASQYFDNIRRNKFRRLIAEDGASRQTDNPEADLAEKPFFTLKEIGGIPGSLKNFLLGILFFLFALNIYFIPNILYVIVDSKALWAQIALVQIELVFAYLLGYMFGRNYLRSKPFLCDSYPASGNSRFIYLFCMTVTIAFASWKLCETFGWLHVVPEMIIAWVVFAATVIMANPATIMEGTRPYLLFLRRFHGFGDRSMIISVLKNLPKSLSITFLVSPQNRLVSWDPLLILLHGQKLGSLLDSMPYYFISSNETWVDNVRRMMRHARAIIIDVSQISESIETEIHLIKEQGFLKRTMFVSDTDKSEIFDFLKKNNIDINDTQINFLVTGKSWRRSLLRMLIGFILLAPAVSITSNLLVPIGFSWMDSHINNEIFLNTPTINLVANLITVFMTLILFKIFFFKASLDRKSEMELKAFMVNTHMEDCHQHH